MPREDYNLLNKDIYSSNKLISFERFHLIRRTQKKSIYFRPSKTLTYEEFNMFWVRKNRLPNMLNVFWAHKSKSRLPKMYKKHNLARKIRARYVRARKRILKWAKRWKWGSDSISKNGSYCRNLKDVIWFKKKKSKVSNVKLPKKKKKLLNKLNKLKISKVLFNSYFKSYMKHFLTKCFRPAPDFAIHLKKFLNRILSLKSRLFKMIHYFLFEINKLEGKRIKIVEERQRKIVEKMHRKILEINLKKIFHKTFKRDLDNFKRVYKIYGIITLKEHSGNLKILNLIIDQSTLNKKTRNKKTLEDITKEVSDILINIFKNKPKWTKKKYKNKQKWTKKKYKNKQKWTKKNIKTNQNGLKKNIKTNKKNIKTNKKNVFKAKRLLI